MKKPLSETHPELAAEWHPELNGSKSPAEVTSGSNQKVWWLGACGHHWDSVIHSRSTGTGCPYCAGQRALSGFNDLGTKFPNLLSEWDLAKNANLDPEKLLPYSSKQVWWKCKNDHVWQASISNRTQGRGCGKCVGRQIAKGENDLATLRPELAKEWSTENKRSADSVRPGSDYQALWTCELGHTYKARVSHRALSGSACPYCAGKKVLKGFNDLNSTHPAIASTWDYESNGGVTPDTVKSGSHKKFFWICSLGHSFLATIDHRTREQTGCPYCSFRALLVGFNDLLSQDPIVAWEWDQSKNELKPEQVMFGGHTKYWFKCESGHEWKTDLITRRKSGCPSCAKYGFKADQPAFLYLLKNSKLKALKIGITNKKTTRLQDFQKTGWELLVAKEFDIGHQARELETVLKRVLDLNISKSGYVERSEMGRLGGFTETAEWSDKLEKKLLSLIRS